MSPAEPASLPACQPASLPACQPASLRAAAASLLEGLTRDDLAERSVLVSPDDLAPLTYLLGRECVTLAREAYGDDLAPWLERIRAGDDS